MAAARALLMTPQVALGSPCGGSQAQCQLLFIVVAERLLPCKGGIKSKVRYFWYPFRFLSKVGRWKIKRATCFKKNGKVFISFRRWKILLPLYFGIMMCLCEHTLTDFTYSRPLPRPHGVTFEFDVFSHHELRPWSQADLNGSPGS